MPRLDDRPRETDRLLFAIHESREVASPHSSESKHDPREYLPDARV
jgi:hypothetical protein